MTKNFHVETVFMKGGGRRTIGGKGREAVHIISKNLKSFFR